MIRPCFLVIDREHSGSISTRKLVIETAKFNVLTAYSAVEAIATLEKFPALDGVVMDALSLEMTCEELVRSLKGIKPKIPIIVVKSPRMESSYGDADHVLPSFDPRRLLEVLQQLCPGETREIEQRNEALEAEDCS